MQLKIKVSWLLFVLFYLYNFLQFHNVRQATLLDNLATAFSNHRQIILHKNRYAVRLNRTEKPNVAILICSKSLRQWRNVSDTSLYTTLLPSITRTVESYELFSFSIHVFIAYDYSDGFYNNCQNRMELKFRCNFKLTFVSVPKRKKNKILFNALAQVALKVGSDFFVRINDDSEFISNSWVTKGIQALESLNPKYVGVVGPTCPDGNTKILTHDMVHRTHMRIFGEYYPDAFENFFLDDWISSVYGSNRTIRMLSWIVRHHIYRHGTRYKARIRKLSHLNSSIIDGKRRIKEYFLNELSSTLLEKRHEMVVIPTPC
jgi:hypothetical protein